MPDISDVAMNDIGTIQVIFASCVPNTQENSNELRM